MLATMRRPEMMTLPPPTGPRFPASPARAARATSRGRRRAAPLV